MRSDPINPPAPLSAEGDQAGRSDTATSSPPVRRSLRILVAEDNEINQRVASCLLESRGHSVVLAGNGLIALSCLETGHFDLVFMDVQMPEMSGFDATRAIRNNESKTGAHIPIVAVTAHALKGDRERCLEAGMDAYLPKPIQPQELFRVIDELVLASGTVGPARAESKENPEPHGDALLDRSALLASVGGNAEMLGKIAGLFLKRCPAALAELRNTVGQGDCDSLARAAHTLKGGGGAFLTKAAIEILTRLQSMGREGDLTNVEAALTALEKEMVLIKAELAVLATGTES
jgi:CheY-like chemotaxis protein